MKTKILAALAVTIAVLAAFALAALDRGPAGAVYTVESLRVALAQYPATLLGHTVSVRGAVLAASGATAIELQAPGALHSLRPPLLLHPVLGTGFGPMLRGLPLLGRLMAQPQTLRVGAATYRIRITSFNGRPCRDDPFTCYYGLLVDASPEL